MKGICRYIYEEIIFPNEIGFFSNKNWTFSCIFTCYRISFNVKLQILRKCVKTCSLHIGNIEFLFSIKKNQTR